MELNQLRYFLELCKYEHIMKTADLLNISQPALSRSLAGLERELGMQLFDRSGKSIRLNKNGEQFALYAEKALSTLQLGIERSKNIRYEMTGSISILNYAYAPILASCVGEYARLNPCVSFKISQFSLGKSLKNNENPDFILCTSHETGFDNNEDVFWVREPLVEDEFVLAATGELLDLPPEQESISLSECRSLPFAVMYQRSIFFQDPAYYLCHSMGYYPRVMYETDSYPVKMDLIARGLAVGILPRRTVEDRRSRFSSLRVFRLEQVEPHHTVCLLRQRRSVLSETAADFWDFTLEYFHRPPDLRE